MISITLPSKQKIKNMFNSSHELTYLEVGESLKENMPDGYYHISYTKKIGNGQACYNKAREKFQNWDMLKLPWIVIQKSNAMKPGEIVIFTIKFLFLNFTVMDKIVDFGLSDNEIKMAYGTLDEHVEIGEELFHLAIDEPSGDVTFSIRSFSKVKNPILRMGNPFIRRLQRKFVRESVNQLMCN